MKLGPLLPLVLLCGFGGACSDAGSKRANADVDAAETDSAAAETDSAAADTGVTDSAAGDTAPVEDSAPEEAVADTVPADTTVPDSADTSADEASDTVDDAPTDGDAGWSFDAAALLEGAFSNVPDEALAAYPAALGGQLTRHTAVTGVEFHIPGVISSKGLSATPIPLRREENGVAFWQVSGELSARIVDDLGIYRVVGPIDSHGVNHRDETFDPFEPSEADPDEPASHPRAGLPGAFFAIRWPVSGFNGAIIQYQAAADAGFNWPQAAFAWLNVDAAVLLDAGYALATVGAGATVYARVEDDGSSTIDTNPESGSGIFWTEDPDLWPDNGVWQTERSRIVPYMRAVEVDAEMRETPLAVATVVELYVADWNEETGAFGLNIQDDMVANPFFTWPAPAFVAPELMRDALVVFENVLGQATGMSDLWTCYLGWSGSGVAAWQLATGKQSNAFFGVPRALGSAPGAGNFDVWNDPSSGRRFDAFVVYEGSLPWPWFSDDTDLDKALVSADVDPDYPIGAPYVLMHSDVDQAQANPFVAANAVARAWAGSKMAGESIDDYLSIQHLQKLNHQQRDQLFTTWDRAPFDDGLWWEPALGDAPESLNQEGRGLRISESYARMFALNGPGIQGYASTLHTMPRMTPMYLALFAALRAHTANGSPLPRSHVDPDLFEHLDTITAETLFPLYEHPCPTDPESPWEDFLACRDGLQNDGAGLVAPLLAGELDALRYFARDNPLTRSTEPLLVPDVATPLGYFYYVYGSTLRRDFTHEELVARYGTHEGYVAAFEAASHALSALGLWDATLAEHYVQAARNSGVLEP